MGLWLGCEDGGTCQTWVGDAGKEEALWVRSEPRWKERIASCEMDRPLWSKFYIKTRGKNSKKVES